MPTEPPFITGFIKIDKADNLFVHLIGGFDMSDLDWIRAVMKRGTRVTAVWEKVKNGCIMDIKYFKPLFVA
jgi:uncharacterized OB-fold protein